MRSFLIDCLQVTIAILWGAPVWFALQDSGNREAMVIGTLFAGIGGAWFTVSMWNRWRYGKSAKTGME